MMGLGKLRRVRSAIVRCLFALLIAVCVPHFAHAETSGIGTGVISATPMGSFAVADLDGDSQPDLATLQSSRSGLNRDYWLRLHLSASGRSYLHLAVSGFGLEVSARDVNGDHAIDLVFAAPWQSRPVAILLNDGRGNFSQASPSAFPAVLVESQTGWLGSAANFVDAVGVPQSSSGGIFHLTALGAAAPEQPGLLDLLHSEQLPDLSLSPSADRAPPLLAISFAL
jgi:hypothetical protein